jgi:diguanylate cyclase (GGDEF)-like protein
MSDILNNTCEIKRNSILVVDDERSNISALRAILSPQYTIYASSDGADALETAKEFHPDVILLDIIMPEMDGYNVISELKSNEKTWDIPVIFISGLDGNEAEEKGLTLGAADYIPKPFNAGIVKLRVNNQIKIVNQIRTINDISNTDQLTAIANRRGFDAHLQREWGRTIREKLSISVLILDVDDFKNYNDTFGHNQGDVALQMIANSLKASIQRSTDIAARWGGEEFIILLPNTDAAGAIGVGERIRAGIQRMPIPLLNGGPTALTVSVGAYTHHPTMECSVKNFIDRADQALYTAKKTGKNKVSHFSE